MRARGQSRGWPPRACHPHRLLLNRGAAATDGVQPEQVQVQVAAMDIDSPVRAGFSVPVTGAVTEPVTATAMEGVSVEVEGLPGPLAMVVYTGEAGGAAAGIGAAIATEPSPVQSAAPVTLAPVGPVPSRPKRKAARLVDRGEEIPTGCQNSRGKPGVRGAASTTRNKRHR